MFLRSRRRTRVASLPILDPFAASAPGGVLSRRRIRADSTRLTSSCRRSALAGPLRVRALVWVRWPRTGRPRRWRKPAIAAEVHQPLDVHGDLAPQIALDHVVAVDHLADLQHFLVGQLRHPPLIRNPDLLHDFMGLFRPDAMDVLQCDDDALVGRDIDAGDAGHGFTPVAGPIKAGRLFQSTERSQTITRHPPRSPGPGIVRTSPTWMPGY